MIVERLPPIRGTIATYFLMIVERLPPIRGAVAAHFLMIVERLPPISWNDCHLFENSFTQKIISY
jgi:hypothetical protein